MKSRRLALIAACAVLVASGVVHGIWTQRWQPTSDALQTACARLRAVPETAGPWQGIPMETDSEPYQEAGAMGYWMRRYTKKGTDIPVTVILMCGRPDRMAVHTPDVCYQSAGYAMAGDQIQATVAMPSGGPKAEFWTARFRQQTKSAGRELRIYWSWSGDDAWRAPASPRWTFAGQAFLYKLYVALDSSADGSRDGVVAEFLQHLLPVLDKALFPGDPKHP
jgi:hypothetical protein